MKVVLALITISSFLVFSFQNCSEVNFETAASSVYNLSCFELEPSSFDPEIKWDWQKQLSATPSSQQYAHFNQVMSSPMVGDIDNDGIPEIVTIMFSKSEGHFSDAIGPHHMNNGALRVIDGATGQTKFSVVGDSTTLTHKEIAPLGHTSPLLVDLDGDKKLEIVYLHYLRQSVVAINSDGSKRWTMDLGRTMGSCVSGLSAVQLPGGGTEVLIGNQVVGENSAQAPTVLKTISAMSALSCNNYAMSINPNTPGSVQFIGEAGVYNSAGSMEFSLPGGYKSVADVRSDYNGLEIVSIGSGEISMHSGTTGQEIFHTDLNMIDDLKCTSRDLVGGGVTTIGNFDEDPDTIEIATATGRYLTILNDRGDLIDQFETQDCSSQRTGITSFDFNGDGKPEILYGDEEYFRVFQIKDGSLTELFRTANPSGTLLEYPVVADVNGDGTAEIVLVANNYAAASGSWYTGEGESEEDRAIALETTGVRVFGAKEGNSWMPTRSIWHQYFFNSAMLSDSNEVLESTPVNGTAQSFMRNSQLGIFQPICEESN